MIACISSGAACHGDSINDEHRVPGEGVGHQDVVNQRDKHVRRPDLENCSRNNLQQGLAKMGGVLKLGSSGALRSSSIGRQLETCKQYPVSLEIADFPVGLR
jgi:hypothetical protein